MTAFGKTKLPYQDNKAYSQILFNLSDKSYNSNQLSKIIGKSQGIVYRQIKDLYDDDYLLLVSQKQKTYRLNPSVISKLFIDRIIIKGNNTKFPDFKKAPDRMISYYSHFPNNDKNHLLELYKNLLLRERLYNNRYLQICLLNIIYIYSFEKNYITLNELFDSINPELFRDKLVKKLKSIWQKNKFIEDLEILCDTLEFIQGSHRELNAYDLTIKEVNGELLEKYQILPKKKVKL